MADEESDAPDDTPDATDEIRQAELTRAQKRRRETNEDFWRRTLGTDIGRSVIWELLINLHTFEERFACGPNGFPQVEATWHHAGERDAGLRLYQTFLRIDHENVYKMHLEHDANFAKPKRKRTEDN